jgi:hypothetical protein
MTEETLETIILGHIAKELKDEIQIGRQVNLAKTIMQALRIHDVSNRRELLCAFFKYFRDNGEANIGMTIEGFVDGFLSTQ